MVTCREGFPALCAGLLDLVRFLIGSFSYPLFEATGKSFSLVLAS